MTFKEWYLDNEINTYDKTEYDCMKEAWNAAIEAASTKLARGTNLYNICGDHISGQVIDSITQLKSS